MGARLLRGPLPAARRVPAPPTPEPQVLTPEPASFTVSKPVPSITVSPVPHVTTLPRLCECVTHQTSQETPPTGAAAPHAGQPSLCTREMQVWKSLRHPAPGAQLLAHFPQAQEGGCQPHPSKGRRRAGLRALHKVPREGTRGGRRLFLCPS